MVRLIAVLILVLFILIGCVNSRNDKLTNEQIIDYIQSADFTLAEIIERKSVENTKGYHYKFKIIDTNEVSTNYIFSEKLFSINELVLVLEIEENTLILIDIS